MQHPHFTRCFGLESSENKKGEWCYKMSFICDLEFLGSFGKARRLKVSIQILVYTGNYYYYFLIGNNFWLVRVELRTPCPLLLSLYHLSQNFYGIYVVKYSNQDSKDFGLILQLKWILKD